VRWPFSRRGNETAAPARAVEPARDAPQPVQRKAEWATLPPIQRAAAAPIELTAESGLFVEHLATHDVFEPALQPLGHNVTLEAPAGIATGIARPVEHRSDGPQLQHRLHPVPSAPAAARSNPFAGSLPSVAPQSVARAEAPAAASSPTAMTAPSAPETTSTPAPVQRAPEAPVQRAPEAPVVSSTPPAPAADPPPLVLRTPASAPAPVAPAQVGRHEEPVESPPAEAAAPSEETAAPVQRAPDEEPIAAAEQAATMPAEEVARAEEEEEVAPLLEGEVQRAAEEPSAPTVGTRPVVAVQGFRSSLGQLPATFGPGRPDSLTYAAQRAPVGGAAAPAAAPSIAASAPGVVQRAAEGSPAATAESVSGTPSEPVQRAADTTQPAPAAPAPAASPLARQPEAAAPAGPSIPTAPPVGERPLGLGLGAPLKSSEVSPSGVPTVPQSGPLSAGPTTFRRTRSSLGAQRAPEGTPSPLTPQVAPQAAPASPDPSPPRADQQPPPVAVQRASTEASAQPLPPARAPFAPGVQRAPADVPQPFDEGVQRAEETPSAVAPASGLDAFIARVAALNAGDTADGPEPVQRAAEDGGSTPLLITKPTGRLAPRLDLPRRRRASAPPSSSSAPSSGALALQRAPEAALQALPVVGRRPLRVQRSADDVPAPVRAHVESQTATSLGAVKVHRSPESGSAARELKAKAFTTGGEIHMPADHGPLDREPARSLVAHELVHVAQQRQLGDSLPSEDSPEGRVLESQAQRVEVSTAQSSSPLVLARKPDPGTIAETAAAIAVQRVAAGNGSGSGWPGSTAPASSTVQRAVEIQELTTSVNVSDSARSGQGSPGGGGADSSHAPDPITGLTGSPGASSPQPLDEGQLRQAWTYIRTQITDELTEDRERAGLTIDLF
jgi:Domain of unknown function (DUF4157)